MVCSACGRRVDADRSFCRNCGSATFIEADELRPRWALPTAPAEQPIERHAEVPTIRTRAARATTAARRAKSSTTKSSASGCLFGLVRFAIYVAIVWYVGNWLYAIPEVRTLLSAFASGAFTDAQLNAALNAIRDHLFSLLN